MTYDLLETFREYFKNDEVILDTYKLADGYYYVFDDNGEFQKMNVLKGEADDYELEKYVKIRDFYSKYISSNKAIDTNYSENVVDENGNKIKYTVLKKICSNNIYTLFFKNKSVLGICGKDADKDAVPIEVFEKGIEKYYKSLLNLGNGKKEEILLKEKYTDKEVEKNKIKMIESFEKVCEDLKNGKMPKETWIKIFLKRDEDLYLKAAEKYIKIKLFNTNDNNIKIEDNVYGSNNYNFGLNNKKPYLELKSTPFKVGSFINDEDIEIMNKMYIWLYNNVAGKDLLKLPTDWQFHGIPEQNQDIKDKNTFIVKVAGNNGVARIDDYKYISKFNTKIRKFICRDYLRKNQPIIYDTENIYQLNSYTSNIWFAEYKESTRNYIKDAYNDYDGRIMKSSLSNWKKELLKEYKDIFLELFEEENSKNFSRQLDNMAIKIIEKMYVENVEQKKSYLANPRNAFNLWISYKEYFDEKGENYQMKYNDIQEQCEKIIQQNGKIETDEQYYFLAGQVVYYLLIQSKADKLTQDVTEPFLKVSSVKKLKEEIEFLYKKYSYDIYLKYPKFNNVLSQILLQEPEEGVKKYKTEILAGILSNNLFFSKQELSNGGSENGENE